jgi:hypothetical protein
MKNIIENMIFIKNICGLILYFAHVPPISGDGFLGDGPDLLRWYEIQK